MIFMCASAGSFRRIETWMVTMDLDLRCLSQSSTVVPSSGDPLLASSTLQKTLYVLRSFTLSFDGRFLFFLVSCFFFSFIFFLALMKFLNWSSWTSDATVDLFWLFCCDLIYINQDPGWRHKIHTSIFLWEDHSAFDWIISDLACLF